MASRFDKYNRDRYKEKNCKTCDKPHKKRGLYCSQGCANSDREVSDNVRENMRKVAIEQNRTPEGVATNRMFASGITVPPSDDFAIQIPDTPDLSDYSEFLEGYERGEKW